MPLPCIRWFYVAQVLGSIKLRDWLAIFLDLVTKCRAVRVPTYFTNGRCAWCIPMTTRKYLDPVTHLKTFGLHFLPKCVMHTQSLVAIMQHLKRPLLALSSENARAGYDFPGQLYIFWM